MTGAGAVRRAAAELGAAGVPDPVRDARRLFAHALGIAPGRVTLALADPVPPDAEMRLAEALRRRAAREPVSRILGSRGFWGRPFEITPDVLDPRPETESLVEIALDVPFTRLLDLGTGSGCLLVTLLAERPDADGTGTDISAAALAVAARNATRHSVRAHLAEGSWFAPVAGRFDLIVSNPPYIAADEIAGLSPEVSGHDPYHALSPGADGLAAYRAIAAGAAAHLSPGGRILLEIGHRQGSAVRALLRDAGLASVRIHPDLDGRDRVVSAISDRR